MSGNAQGPTTAAATPAATPAAPPAKTKPLDTDIYSLTSTPIGQHCIAGAGFDTILPAAEFLCRRRTNPEPGLKIEETLRVTGTVGQGLTATASVIGTSQAQVGGQNLRVQGGASLDVRSGDSNAEFRVGVRTDFVGSQSSGPNANRPYVEVIGSSRDGRSSVGVGVCTDVTVGILPTKPSVEVCTGVVQRPGDASGQVRFGARLNL